VFCACEIELLSVVLYVVRAVPKLDFRLVINKTLRHIVINRTLRHIVINNITSYSYKQNITSYSYKQNVTSYGYRQNISHIVINKTLPHTVTENGVLTGPSVCVCPRPSSLVFQDATHAVKVNCSLLSKEQYLPSEYYLYIVCLFNQIV
jgi:hypothetical protein